jgi:cytoskeletal protein CcmA (bactofilin family)
MAVPESQAPPSAPPSSAGGAAPPPPPGAASPTPPPAPTPPLLVGVIEDSGVVFRESVRARSWRSLGPTKVTGSVEVEEAELTGPAAIGGSLTAGRLRTTGTLEVDGPAKLTSPSTLTGVARFGSSLDALDLMIRGSLTASGSLRAAGLLRLEGALRAPDVTAGRLVLDGDLEVSGAVVSDLGYLRLHHASTVGTLKVATLDVARRIAFPFNLVPFRVPFIGPVLPHLSALRIEGVDVKLEGVSAEFLKADRIVLGPDCHIAHVEGTIVHQDPKARVGPESRSPPPHGLSR